MKEKLHKILSDLNDGKKTVSQTQGLVLDLFGISLCFNCQGEIKNGRTNFCSDNCVEEYGK